MFRFRVFYLVKGKFKKSTIKIGTCPADAFFKVWIDHRFKSRDRRTIEFVKADVIQSYGLPEHPLNDSSYQADVAAIRARLITEAEPDVS